jgi:hypothetical protein
MIETETDRVDRVLKWNTIRKALNSTLVGCAAPLPETITKSEFEEFTKVIIGMYWRLREQSGG